MTHALNLSRIGALALCTLLSQTAVAGLTPALLEKPAIDLHATSGVAGTPDPDLLSKDPSDIVAMDTMAHDRCFVRRDNSYFCQARHNVPSDAYWSDWYTRYPWGYDTRITQASLGTNFGCAIRAGDGRVVCYGNDDWGKASPPTGEFVKIAAGAQHVCGIRASDRSIDCWGAGDGSDYGVPHWGQAVGSSEGDFIDVASGYRHSCGLTSSGRVICWGGVEYNAYGRIVAVVSDLSALEEYSLAHPFVQIENWEDEFCGIREDGVAICRRPDDLANHRTGYWTLPFSGDDAPVSQISYNNHRCIGVSSDDRVVGFGYATSDISDSHLFNSVSQGIDYACGITSGHDVLCWEDSLSGPIDYSLSSPAE